MLGTCQMIRIDWSEDPSTMASESLPFYPVSTHFLTLFHELGRYLRYPAEPALPDGARAHC